MVTHRVYQNCRQFQVTDELKTAIIEAWAFIPIVECRKLLDSMSKRCIEVIERSGAEMDY